MNQEPPPLADETGVAPTTWRGLPRSLVVVAVAVGVVFRAHRRAVRVDPVEGHSLVNTPGSLRQAGASKT